MSVEVVAEIGGSHGGDMDNALKLIMAAKASGADSIKMQCFSPLRLATARGFGEFQGRPLLDIYEETYTDPRWFVEMINLAVGFDLQWFSSAFDPMDVEFLESMDCPRYKISSFDVNNHPLIDSIRQTGKPAILSTGMATDVEINRAVCFMISPAQPHPTVLHCVSGYPTPRHEANIRRIKHLRDMLPLTFKIGFSDHTLSTVIPAAAVALGAEMIEKHIKLDDVETVDSSFSLPPREFWQMVINIREVESAMQHGVAHSEESSRPYRVVK